MNWNDIFLKRNHQGYKRVSQKLEELGFKKTFKIFNIVGTNGKGSLAQYLTDSFIESGKKVGTFTSPHIFKANERIKINNKEISNKDFFAIARDLNFSFFEILFMTAMIYFANNDIDIAIIEAGIGGSQDTTKAVLGDWGVVTSIGLDHEKILGSTLKEIAREKAGIYNNKMSFFVPSSLDSSLQKEFQFPNSTLIKNSDKNYRLENIKLAKGILKKMKVKPVIKDVPYRTQVIHKKDHNVIVDVGHNLDGINASVELLRSKNIDFERVVISIKKEKWKQEILNSFKGKEIVFFQEDETYYSGEKTLENITKDFNCTKKDTLYIGTFRTIEKLKEKKYISSSFRRLALGNMDSWKLNIFMMIIVAFLIGMNQVLNIFLRFKIGPMEISLDYVFDMIFGLFFGIFYGMFFSIINDILKITFITGFGQWMWQYAIEPPIVAMIAALFKEYVWDKEKRWLSTIIIVFAFVDLLSLTTILINNKTSTYHFRNDHKNFMILFYITLSVLLTIQIIVISNYLFLKKYQKNLKRFINSLALTMIILVVISLIWGPFAVLAYLNRFVYETNKSMGNEYFILLIPRIIKIIPESLVWSFVLFSIYETIQYASQKAIQNRW